MKIVQLNREIIDYGIKLIAPLKQWNTTCGENINVAVLDTGIDYTHEDLKANVKGGINFTSSNREDYIDRAGHGTFCAGIIGAAANGVGIIGVAPKVNLYAVKVLNDKSQGTLNWLLNGIDWCIHNNIDIINMSLGFDKDYPKLHEAVVRAYNNDIVMLAAVGNNKLEPDAEFPARYEEVIGITAIDSMKHIAKFNTLGSKVEVAAPGVNITSTYLNNQYAIGSGTSFAVPHIAGAIALIQSNTLKLNGKKMKNVEIRQFIKDKCEDLGIKGRDRIYGYGMFKFE